MVTNFHLKYRFFEHLNHICTVAVVVVWRPTQLQKHTYIHFNHLLWRGALKTDISISILSLYIQDVVKARK